MSKDLFGPPTDFTSLLHPPDAHPASTTANGTAAPASTEGASAGHIPPITLNLTQWPLPSSSSVWVALPTIKGTSSGSGGTRVEGTVAAAAGGGGGVGGAGSGVGGTAGIMDGRESSHLAAAIFEAEVTQAAVNSDSPMDVAMTILTVFILSPLIICGNSLLLASFRRYKRLRTPSNCLVASLAVADLGVGLFLPFAVYFELSQSGAVSSSVVLCLLPYSAPVVLCGVSLISMTAIALDRYTSLARPLRYNNIITKASVGRYVALFWIYSLLLGSTPIIAALYSSSPSSATYFSSSSSSSNDDDDEPGGGGSGSDAERFVPPPLPPLRTRFTCSFDLVSHQVRLFLFFMLYAPCAFLLLFSYAYVYIVAMRHAHAIYSVELSVRQNNNNNNNNSHAQNGTGHHHHHHHRGLQRRSHSLGSTNRHHHNSFHPRYGRTLAITVGFFLLLWCPFQVAMLSDALGRTHVLRRKWTTIYLAFVALSNSAFNPWVYGYRNAEFRLAFQRILEDLFSKLGMAKKQQEAAAAAAAFHHHHHGHGGGGGGHHGRGGGDMLHGTDLDLLGGLSPGEAMNSCASNIRLCVSPNHLTMTTTLLRPSYGVTQETSSCGSAMLNGDPPTNNSVVFCETIISTTHVP